MSLKWDDTEVLGTGLSRAGFLFPLLLRMATGGAVTLQREALSLRVTMGYMKPHYTLVSFLSSVMDLAPTMDRRLCGS